MYEDIDNKDEASNENTLDINGTHEILKSLDKKDPTVAELMRKYEISYTNKNKWLKMPVKITFNYSSSWADIYSYDIIITKNGIKVDGKIDSQIFDFSTFDKNYNWESIDNTINNMKQRLLEKAWSHGIQNPDINHSMDALKKVYKKVMLPSS